MGSHWDDEERPFHFRREETEQPTTPPADEPEEIFYRALLRLNGAGVPYLVGGAYAFAALTGITHATKDLDLFVRRIDCRRLLDVLARDGWTTEVTFPHWLAKARRGPHLIDVIFSSGNGEAPVDDIWLDEAIPAEVCGVPVSLCPIEEAIWMKAFVMERERYDGADIAHLFKVAGERIDWHRLLWRFGARWPVLLSHVVLFGFVYPGERECVPNWLIGELTQRLCNEWGQMTSPPRVCRGALLSRSQYAVDLNDWSYLDARVYPLGKMTPEEAEAWSDAAMDTPRLK